MAGWLVDCSASDLGASDLVAGIKIAGIQLAGIKIAGNFFGYCCKLRFSEDTQNLKNVQNVHIF